MSAGTRQRFVWGPEYARVPSSHEEIGVCVCVCVFAREIFENCAKSTIHHHMDFSLNFNLHRVFVLDKMD